MSWIDDFRKALDEGERQAQEQLARENAAVTANNLRVIDAARRLEPMVVRNVNELLQLVGEKDRTWRGERARCYVEKLVPDVIGFDGRILPIGDLNWGAGKKHRGARGYSYATFHYVCQRGAHLWIKESGLRSPH